MKLMKVEHIKDRETFRTFSEAWDNFLFNSPQNTIFLTHEWFSSWWDSFSGDKYLEILCFRRENDEIAGLVPLMKEGKKLSFIASSEVTDFCDFITEKQGEEEFFSSFLEFVRKNYAHDVSLEFTALPHTSTSLVYLTQLAPSFGFSVSSSEVEKIAFLNLPNSYDLYLRSMKRKKRHELRRKKKKMESIKGVRRLTLKKKEELEEYMRRFILLHSKSSPDKFSFWEKEGMPEFFQNLVSRLSPKGWVQLELLLLGEKIIAALLNFVYFNKLYFYNSAFDREFAALSPGFYLFLSCIREAIEKGREVANFLRGGERYKYDFGAHEGRILRLVLKSERRRR